MSTPYVEYLNNIILQLVHSFNTESNKISYIRNGVIRKKWETSPLKNISTSQLNFDQLEMELNESIKLEREI